MLPATSLILLAWWLAILFKLPKINEKHDPGKTWFSQRNPTHSVCVSDKNICPFNKWENQQIEHQKAKLHLAGLKPSLLTPQILNPHFNFTTYVKACAQVPRIAGGRFSE